VLRKNLATLANSLAVFAALLALWQSVLWIFRVPAYMLPSPWAVARAVAARLPSLGTSFAITAEEECFIPTRSYSNPSRSWPLPR